MEVPFIRCGNNTFYDITVVIWIVTALYHTNLIRVYVYKIINYPKHSTCILYQLVIFFYIWYIFLLFKYKTSHIFINWKTIFTMIFFFGRNVSVNIVFNYILCVLLNCNESVWFYFFRWLYELNIQGKNNFLS